MDLAIIQEHERLDALLERANVPQQQRDLLAPVIDNLSWMRAKLDDAREDIANSPVCIAYDNGGGQKGTRENPLYKAYLNLWRGYMAGIEKYSSSLPKDLQAEAAGDAITVLDKVKRMKKGSA